MLDRRTFLASSAALGFVTLAGCATTARAPDERDQALHRLLQGWFDEDLRDAPTLATNLGIDTGELAYLRGQLGDASLAKANEERAEAVARHRRLQTFARDGLSPAGQLNYDIAEYRWSTAAARAPFRYGNGGRPYVLSQRDGSYAGIPSFLDTQHPIRNAADAEAYLARLDQYGRNLEQEVERVRHDAGLGAAPPDFVIDKTVDTLRRMRAQPAGETTLVRSLVRRAAAAGLTGDYETRATALVAGRISTALDGQIAALTALRPNATHDAGVWRLPQGEAYYAWTLRSNTTTNLTATEIHDMGLAQVAELQAQLDTLLRAQNYTTGSVGERLNALNREPRFLYANTDEGRAELLADLNRQMVELEPLLPRAFASIPRARVEIRRVPVEIQAGASGGSYQSAPLDGSRPGIYYINLQNTHDWPKWGLPTLTYHEASPGHHFQNALSREQGELPLYRRAAGFTAYGEGWGLYAERVAADLGVYDGDPFGRIGFLQSYLFRAVRLVVDTGLHDKRWSRERAIRYMIDNAAEPENSAVREIERYATTPGQATSYKIGQTVIANLRDEAERRMGARFDIRAFHDMVLLGGSMPLTVLQSRVREWIAA